jgi:hypothetical protein
MLTFADFKHIDHRLQFLFTLQGMSHVNSRTLLAEFLKCAYPASIF